MLIHVQGLETKTTEDSAVETSSRKAVGSKMNGFDPEQRSGELEVIMESDARSESSDLCRASGDSGRGRCTSLDCEGPSFTPPGVSISPDNLLEVRRPSVKLKERVPEPPDTSAKDSEYHITVSRSSQQLREEFFNTVKPTDTRTGVTDNIGVSLGGTKNVPTTIKSSKTADAVTDSKNISCAELDIKKESDLELTPKSITSQSIRSKKNNSESTLGDVQKSAQKSPLLTKKGNKAGSLKSTNLSDKSESTPKCAIEQSKTADVELSHQLKPNISSKTKSDLSSKKDTSKSQSKPSSSSEIGLDVATSSATLPKNVKVQETSSPSSGKPPSGSARQRKKATSKVPNRDSLDSLKKKKENDKT